MGDQGQPADNTQPAPQQVVTPAVAVNPLSSSAPDTRLAERITRLEENYVDKDTFGKGLSNVTETVKGFISDAFDKFSAKPVPVEPVQSPDSGTNTQSQGTTDPVVNDGTTQQQPKKAGLFDGRSLYGRG